MIEKYKNAILDVQESIKNISSLTSHPVRIIAVSKKRTEAEITNIIHTNLVSNFAENYVQEAKSKWGDIKNKYPNIKLHLIGKLQSNKISLALSIFDVIHTIDSEALAEKIAKHNPQNKEFFIQVNLDPNKQAGVALDTLPALIEKCKTLNLNIVGLMAMPPQTENQAPYFALMKKLQSDYNLNCLSMGTTGDYKEALKFGATHIRLGSKLFD